MIGWKQSSAKESGPHGGEETTVQAEAEGSSVTPRHVLCFLGRERDLSTLSEAASQAIRDFATGFSVDQNYSQAEPDDRMVQSFAVCWDRVEADARQTSRPSPIINRSFMSSGRASRMRRR